MRDFTSAKSLYFCPKAQYNHGSESHHLCLILLIRSTLEFFPLQIVIDEHANTLRKAGRVKIIIPIPQRPGDSLKCIAQISELFPRMELKDRDCLALNLVFFPLPSLPGKERNSSIAPLGGVYI